MTTYDELQDTARFWVVINHYIELDVLSSFAPDLPARYKTWSECYDDQLRQQGVKYRVLLDTGTVCENWEYTICWFPDIAVLINREWQANKLKPL